VQLTKADNASNKDTVRFRQRSVMQRGDRIKVYVMSGRDSWEMRASSWVQLFTLAWILASGRLGRARG
jgi:hypothetical protein